MSDSLISWPEYALEPYPLNESYAQVLPKRVGRTEMEQGDPRQRRTARRAATQLQVTLPFTPDQYEIFLGFQDAVDGGKFRVPVFRSNRYQTVTVQIVKDSVKPQRQGGEWIVSMVWETMDRLAPTGSELGALLLTTGTDLTLEEVADLLHQLVHVDIPAAL